MLQLCEPSMLDSGSFPEHPIKSILEPASLTEAAVTG